MKLWLCGQLKSKWSPKGSIWEFQGIFSNKKKAVKACIKENYFIFPIKLDQELPEEPVIPKDAFYPKG